MGRPSPSDTPSPVASALGRQAADAETAAETARQSLLGSAAVLGLDGQPQAASLDSEEAHLEAARNGLDAWNSANARVEEASRREKLQEQRLAEAVKEQEAAAASAQEMQQEWRQWLRERELDETLTADTMTAFLARVETARAGLAEARRMRDRVAAIEKDIEEFRDRVEPLAAAHGIAPASGDRRQLGAAADTLINRLAEAQAASSERKLALEQREEAQRLRERQEQRLTAAQQELDALLAAGGADGPEDFRLRARQHQERLELDRQRGERARSLERLSGPGGQFDAFRAVLAGTDLARLEDESVRLSARSQQVKDDRIRLLEERGGIDHELERLTGEEESSRLRSQRHTLLEQLRERATEWSRLTVAEALLEKTRQKFEMERQPSVIQNAQGFFSHITGQKYNRLYAPIGQQTVTVMDTTGGSKQPSELSRGTREQLYLALRFGLVREFGEHAERLPVVVDEALVNFDPERARLAAESFAALSETNQVLVFTCHPGMAEMFANSAGAQVMEVQPTSAVPI